MLCEAQRRDGIFLGGMGACNSRGEASGVMWLAVRYWWTEGRGFAHEVAVRAVLEVDTEELVSFDGDSSTSPPWAWVWACDGRVVRRWGWDLVLGFVSAEGGSW